MPQQTLSESLTERLEREGLIDFANASERFSPAADGTRPSPASVRRWAREGVSGVRLEFTIRGGRYFTSAQAVARFREKLEAALVPA